MKKNIILLALFLLFFSFVQAGTGSFHWQPVGVPNLTDKIDVGSIGTPKNPSIAVGCEDISTGTACTTLTRIKDSRDSIQIVFEAGNAIYYTNFNYAANPNAWRTPIKISKLISDSVMPNIVVGNDNKPYVVWNNNAADSEIFFTTCTKDTVQECANLSNWILPENVSNTPASPPDFNGSFNARIGIGPNLVPIVVWVDESRCNYDNKQIHVKKRNAINDWVDMNGKTSTEMCGTLPCDGWILDYPSNNSKDLRQCNALGYTKKAPDIVVDNSNVAHIAFENQNLDSNNSWIPHIQWDGSKWVGFTENLKPSDVTSAVFDENFLNFGDLIQGGNNAIAVGIDINSSGNVFASMYRQNCAFDPATNDSNHYQLLVRARNPGFGLGGKWGAFNVYLPAFEGEIQCFDKLRLDLSNSFRLLDTKISSNNSRTENPNHVYYSFYARGFASPGGGGGPILGEYYSIVREWDGWKKFNSLNNEVIAVVPPSGVVSSMTVSLGMGKTDGNIFLVFGVDNGNNGTIEGISIAKWEKDLDSSKWIQAESTLNTAPPALPNIGVGGAPYTFPSNETQEYFCSFDQVYSEAKPTCNKSPFNMAASLSNSRTECKQASNDIYKDNELMVTQNVDRAYCKLMEEPLTLAIPPSVKEGPNYLSIILGIPFLPTPGPAPNQSITVKVWGKNSSTFMSAFGLGMDEKIWEAFTLPNDLNINISRNSFISFNGSPDPNESSDENTFIDRYRFDKTKQPFNELSITYFLSLDKVSTNSPIIVGGNTNFAFDWTQNSIANFKIYACSINDIAQCKTDTSLLYCNPIIVSTSGNANGTASCSSSQIMYDAKTYDLYVFACNDSDGKCTNPTIDSFKVIKASESGIDSLAVLNVKLSPEKSTYSFTDSINANNSEIKNYKDVDEKCGTTPSCTITVALFNPTNGNEIGKKIFAGKTIPRGTTNLEAIVGENVEFNLGDYSTLTEEVHSIRISIAPAPGENVLGNNSKTTQFLLTKKGIAAPVAVPETNLMLLPIIALIVLFILNRNSFFEKRSR